MERTESTIVQAAPDFENAKIKEMEEFGWSLQGRQEIHEEGDAYGRPSYLSSDTYVVKVKVHQYVKLHFVRSLGLPNLARVKELESEYLNLSFPQKPGIVWPVLFTLMPIPGGLGMISDPLGKTGPGLPGLLVVAAWIFLGLWWIQSRIKKRQSAEQTCAESVQRAVALRQEVAQLLSDTSARSASA